jgi:HEPN domain-containing protein
MPLRRQTNEKDPADWFEMARERISSSDSLWKHDGLTHAGIETLQEGVERYLKGYLIAKGWRLVRTHDLERLVKEAAQFDKVFAKFFSLAEELTEDFFAQHYPGEDTTHVGENYEQMRAAAGELIQEIQKQLPNYFPTT